MFSSSAALPSSFDRFSAIWHVDFEYRQDRNHLPVPVAMFAKEHRTGTEIGPLTRAELLNMRKAPFDTGPSAVMVSYATAAEIGCFRVLSWPLPRNLICCYAGTITTINGQPIIGMMERRPSLLDACDLFGIPHMPKAHKARMRDMILNNETYTAKQWSEIVTYNRDDVELEIPLLEEIAPTLDIPMALYHGRYSVVVAAMEACGLPTSPLLKEFEKNWQTIRTYYIRRDDTFGLYDHTGSFNHERFTKLITSRGWHYDWSRTATGKLEITGRTLGEQAKRHPELQPLHHLREQIAELRLGRFLNTIGEDGFSRCAIKPFWTVTGRNQPGGHDRVFLLSLPSWTHGLIAPPPGWGAVQLDWKAQEIGINAGQSRDRGMIRDFLDGDPHIGFGIRAGLAPPGATAETHGDIRTMVKPISLGCQYGMTKYGAAAQSGRSLIWAQSMLAAYYHAYPDFIAWQRNRATQALFDERIVSVFGWPMAVHAETKPRNLLNFMAQAGGAECMRIAAIAGHEAGIRIAAPAHDAFWILAPLSELEDTIATMKAIMERAGEAVSGLRIQVDVSAVVRWPQCYGDVRKPKSKGYAMWAEILALLNNGALRDGTATA